MRAKVRAHGPYRHGKRWRVHFVTGSGAARTTAYETFDTRSQAAACVDGARDEAQGITVNAAIKAYVETKRAQGRAPLTIKAYDQRLRILLADYLTRPVRSVQHRGAELYAAVLEGRSADGHRNLLTAGRLWAKWCVKQHWLRANPFAEVEPVGQRVHGADKVTLTIDESRRLEEWCLSHTDDVGAVLTIGYLYLGPRNTELCRRDVRDLDDGCTLLRIGRTKTAAGRRGLRIPEPYASLLAARAEGRPGDAPLFVNIHGRRMSSDSARKHVRRVCRLAGVTVVPPQALRRTHATLAAEVGQTGLAIAQALGHATGGAPKVTGESYVGRAAADGARVERALRVIQGGKAR